MIKVYAIAPPQYKDYDKKVPRLWDYAQAHPCEHNYVIAKSVMKKLILGGLSYE